MTHERPRFDTGIESSSAIMPGPPPFWSYSSLRDARACPRRYALARATYPDLWDGRGYPRVPALAALFGDIVHDALDTIVRQLVAAGCESAQSSEAVAVLRQLGGYTAVIGHAAEIRLADLQGNPRLSDDLRQRVQRELRRRIPDARVRVQAYISSTLISPVRKAQEAGAPEPAREPGTAMPGRRAPLTAGMHAEATLAARQLRLTGRMDLLRVADSGAHITDYKTGAESPDHAEQLRLYALLWDLDQDANPGRLPVTGLTAAYPGRDVEIPVPSASELRDMEKQSEASIAEADAQVAAAVPRAVPSPENCGNCDVRHLCDAYWTAVAPDPAVLPDRAKFDCQGIVGAQNGQHSWWFHVDQPTPVKLLMQTPQAGPELHPGHHVRFLGLRIDADPDSTVTTASMNAFTEVFRLTSTPS